MSAQISTTHPACTGPFSSAHIANVRSNAPAHLSPFVALYAIELLNAAYAQSSTSNARMYCFNLLVRDNFSNNELNTLVDRAFRIGWFNVISRTASSVDLPENIRNSCALVLVGITAELMLSYPNLNNGPLPPDKVAIARNAIAENARLTPELARINFTEIGFNQGQNFPQQHQVSIGTTLVAGAPIGVGLTASNPAIISAGSEWSQDSQVGTGPTLSQAAYVATATSTLPESEVKLDGGASGLFSGVEGGNTLAPVEQPKTPAVEVQYYIPTVKKEIVYPRSTVTHKGNHEMDAIRHSHAYFGTLNGVPGQGSRLGLQNASWRMQQDAALNKPKAERLTVEMIQIVNSVNDVFDFARAQHNRLGREAKTPQYMTRVMAVALNPTYAERVQQETLPDLYANDIRNIGTGLKAFCDIRDPSTLTPEQHSRLVTATFIDRTLGRALNEFLARGLRLSANCLNFADSVGACSDFLSSKFNPDFNGLYQNFLNILGSNLRKYGTKEIIEQLYHSYFADVPPSEDNGVVVVPMGHTVTYCHMTSEELEWTTRFNGADIDGKVTPTLDIICMTLAEDKKSFGFDSTYDWILTGDGEYYLVYENPERIGTYRLFPVSGFCLNRIEK